LTTLFGNTSVSIVTASEATPAAPKKHGWLPLLTVLFLISYGLMTMLIVEQGATIESQRTLIRELFRDSAELSAVKKAQQEANVAEAQRQAQTSATQTQSPVTQYPSPQAPSKQAPSSQAVQHRAQKQAQKQFEMPSRPASDLQDVRRVVRTI